MKSISSRVLPPLRSNRRGEPDSSRASQLIFIKYYENFCVNIGGSEWSLGRAKPWKKI